MANPDIARAGEATRFTPGKSGNPKGRPSKLDKWRELVEKDFAKWTAPYVAARDGEDVKLAIDAAERVFDRVYGRPTQRTEHSGGLSLEQLIGDAGLGEVAE